jgi:hypothetical protein
VIVLAVASGYLLVWLGLAGFISTQRLVPWFVMMLAGCLITPAAVVAVPLDEGRRIMAGLLLPIFGATILGVIWTIVAIQMHKHKQAAGKVRL